MATAISKVPAPAPTPLPEAPIPGAEARFVIPSVTYEQYLRMLDWVGDRAIRLTFDGSNLELMSPSFTHEHGKRLLGRMVEMLCFELDVELTSGGSTTFKSAAVRRGLEPDECYWIGADAAKVGGRSYDIESDPTPSLVIEVEVSSSLVGRLGVYAKLGVPEIWRRRRRDRLEVLRLGDDGEYHPSPGSLCVPMISIGTLAEWLQRQNDLNEHELIKQFVAWVRTEVLPGFNPPN